MTDLSKMIIVTRKNSSSKAKLVMATLTEDDLKAKGKVELQALALQVGLKKVQFSIGGHCVGKSTPRRLR